MKLPGTGNSSRIFHARVVSDLIAPLTPVKTKASVLIVNSEESPETPTETPDDLELIAMVPVKFAMASPVKPNQGRLEQLHRVGHLANDRRSIQ